MANAQTLEIPIAGMDCAECTMHVQHAIEKLPGVQSVNVFLGTEKAVLKLDPSSDPGLCPQFFDSMYCPMQMSASLNMHCDYVGPRTNEFCNIAIRLLDRQMHVEQCTMHQSLCPVDARLLQ